MLNALKFGCTYKKFSLDGPRFVLGNDDPEGTFWSRARGVGRNRLGSFLAKVGHARGWHLQAGFWSPAFGLRGCPWHSNSNVAILLLWLCCCLLPCRELVLVRHAAWAVMGTLYGVVGGSSLEFTTWLDLAAITTENCAHFNRLKPVTATSLPPGPQGASCDSHPLWPCGGAFETPFSMMLGGRHEFAFVCAKNGHIPGRHARSCHSWCRITASFAAGRLM